VAGQRGLKIVRFIRLERGCLNFMLTFIARQPIFDGQQQVYGYEMLFRSGPDNFFHAFDCNAASSKVISDCCQLLGRGGLMQNKRAFINATGDILTNGVIDLLPSKQVIIEILETVEPDEKVLKACRELKSAGYRLSLDDFVYRREYEPFIALADFIKVDFLNTSRDEQLWIADRFLPQGIGLIAEKVEDYSVFNEALGMGYGLFQGFFFSKPQMLSWKEIPGFKLHYFQLLQELQQPEPCFEQITEIIKRNVALTYKLLRYINTAALGLRQEVVSVEHALLLLGETEMKRWLSLILLVSLAKDKPEILLVQTLIRAKFCEMLGNLTGLVHRADDLFMMGMFSLIDAILDRPLAEILGELPLNTDIKNVLLNVGGASPLSLIYECALFYERGDWDSLLRHSTCLKMDEPVVSSLYLEAVEWADNQFENRSRV
jgi:c-di-GMP-related signal transduction protein